MCAVFNERLTTILSKLMPLWREVIARGLGMILGMEGFFAQNCTRGSWRPSRVVYVGIGQKKPARSPTCKPVSNVHSATARSGKAGKKCVSSTLLNYTP